jgi:RNA polymerase sigma-70 factor (ECF subfamily)
MSVFIKKEEEWHQPDFNHPGIAAENKETAAVLFKAIRQLPEQQQIAFLLQKTENLNQADIAEVMNTSIGAVESLLQRAKSNLRKVLEAYYQKHFL